MLRGRVGRGVFPPYRRLEVISLASSSTTEQGQVATRWALDDLAATLINRARVAVHGVGLLLTIHDNILLL